MAWMYKYKLRVVFSAVGLVAMISMFVALKPKPAYSFCDNPASSVAALLIWVKDTLSMIDSFQGGLDNFISLDVSTGQDEVQTRVQEFDENVREGFGDWWNDDMLPAQKDMTAQLNTATIDQTKQLEAQMDAEEHNKHFQEGRQLEHEAHKRMMPSEFACQADSIYPQYGRREQAAQDISRGSANDASKRATAAAGTAEAKGPVAVVQERWERYKANYCDLDANNGVSGCTVAGATPNEDITIGSSFLWGEIMTYTLDTAYNQQKFDDLKRSFVDHNPPAAIPLTRLNSATGIARFNRIRSNAARKQSIHAVIGQMLADRVAGPATEPLPEVQDIRLAAGLPLSDTSLTPSKYEILHALAEERYMTPDFATRLIENPAALLRNNLDSKSLHLQQVTQLQKRMEELSVMLAAEYAHDIDTWEQHDSLDLAPSSN
jgi:hypothetical protein